MSGAPSKCPGARVSCWELWLMVRVGDEAECFPCSLILFPQQPFESVYFHSSHLADVETEALRMKVM